MRERGLIFTGESISGLQSGDKTQSRRVLSPQPILVDGRTWEWPRVTESKEPGKPWVRSDASWASGIEDVTVPMARFCPWQPGGLIWVKETWAEDGAGPGSLHYKASATEADLQWLREKGVKWRSPRFMPRRVSRITLFLEMVRVGRLQDISAGDALAEGVSKTSAWQPKEVDENPKPTHEWAEPYWDDYYFFTHYPQRAYRRLWDSLNAKRGFPWESNSWVWVLEFRLLKGAADG